MQNRQLQTWLSEDEYAQVDICEVVETSFKGNNFSTGNHTVILVCDGVIKDVKQFIKL